MRKKTVNLCLLAALLVTGIVFVPLVYAWATVTNTRQDLAPGSGNASVVESDYYYRAAVATSGSTASTLWDLNTSGSPTPTVVTGSNFHRAALRFAVYDAALLHIDLPGDFTTSPGSYFVVDWLGTDGSSASVTWKLWYSCTNDNNGYSQLDDQAFNLGGTVSTNAPGGNKYATNTTFQFAPNCGSSLNSPGDLKHQVHLMLVREAGGPTSVDVQGMRVGLWRDHGNPY